MKSSVIRLMLLVCLSITGSVAYAEASDPFEHYNRMVYDFNELVDRFTFKPLAKAYRKITPNVVRRHVHNVFENLDDIRIGVNGALQGKFKQAGSDAGRFLLNSTVGVVGIFDVASRVGLEKHDEDFDQTLAVWGVGSGPYVMLPLLGPSTVRGIPGRLVDRVFDPIGYVNPSEDRLALTASELIDKRETLLDAENLLVGDHYLFVRDAFLQRRDYLINDGEVEDGFLDDDWDEEEDEDYSDWDDE